VGDVVWARFRSPAGRLLERPVGELRGERLEEREPVWEPQRYKGRRAIATWWRLTDRARHAGCATLGALRAAEALEFDPQVVTFAAWPVRLGWSNKGGDDGWVPDFFARLTGGQAALVVCPPGGGTTPGWAATLDMLTAAGQQAGWGLRVHQDDGDAVAARNRQRLARWRHARLADPATAQVLHEMFARPRPFGEGVAASGLPQLPTLARGHHMIWNRQLLIDWSRPFLPARSLAWSARTVD
jgi:hypothetical protein